MWCGARVRVLAMAAQSRYGSCGACGVRCGGCRRVCFGQKWTLEVSIPLPAACEAAALPFELNAHNTPTRHTHTHQPNPTRNPTNTQKHNKNTTTQPTTHQHIYTPSHRHTDTPTHHFLVRPAVTTHTHNPCACACACACYNDPTSSPTSTHRIHCARLSVHILLHVTHSTCLQEMWYWHRRRPAHVPSLCSTDGCPAPSRSATAPIVFTSHHTTRRQVARGGSERSNRAPRRWPTTDDGQLAVGVDSRCSRPMHQPVGIPSQTHRQTDTQTHRQNDR